ncbi:DUF6461 domain-containing protein [Streptomyces sp. NPDC052236]|uniref:DUF6461 domain-containing protein n=1 Tax=Streptomyces sp. NPDC052236 TaxID=3365686 RepID=UPI0037D5CD5F
MKDGIVWIADAYETYCLTCVRGVTGTELVTALGGDPAHVIDAAAETDLLRLEDDWGGAARFGEDSSWAWVLERWSATGLDRPRLLALSSGTDALVVLEPGASPRWFVHARDGRTAADFEPGVEPDQWAGHAREPMVTALREAGALRPDGTAVEDCDVQRSLLRAVEIAFGVSLPRNALLHGATAAVPLGHP